MARKTGLIDRFRDASLKNLKKRMSYKANHLEVKEKVHKNPSSLLWVWEFSKKAVLICFGFYIITQIYSMVVMVMYMDFTYLGTFIDSAKELTRDCVFAYLIKAGLENVGKIWFTNLQKIEDENKDGPVG